eukprot:gene17195-20490_t
MSDSIMKDLMTDNSQQTGGFHPLESMSQKVLNHLGILPPMNLTFDFPNSTVSLPIRMYTQNVNVSDVQMFAPHVEFPLTFHSENMTYEIDIHSNSLPMSISLKPNNSVVPISLSVVGDNNMPLTVEIQRINVPLINWLAFGFLGTLVLVSLVLITYQQFALMSLKRRLDQIDGDHLCLDRLNKSLTSVYSPFKHIRRLDMDETTYHLLLRAKKKSKQWPSFLSEITSLNVMCTEEDDLVVDFSFLNAMPNLQAFKFMDNLFTKQQAAIGQYDTLLKWLDNQKSLTKLGVQSVCLDEETIGSRLMRMPSLTELSISEDTFSIRLPSNIHTLALQNPHLDYSSKEFRQLAKNSRHIRHLALGHRIAPVNDISYIALMSSLETLTILINTGYQRQEPLTSNHYSALLSQAVKCTKLHHSIL